MDIIVISSKNRAIYSSTTKFSEIALTIERHIDKTGIDVLPYLVVTELPKPIEDIEGCIYIF